jgi:hypothetical protein
MTFEDFYNKNIKHNKKINQDKEIIDEYNTELMDSIIKININYIYEDNNYEVFLCVVDNRYTKVISNLLNKKFDNKEDAYSYFNELKEVNTLEKLAELL